MQPPELRHVCEIVAKLATPIENGESPGGRWRIIPIIGGEVHGERLSGRVLNLGGDWQTVFDAGYAELDTRYAIETHDGALIDIRNFGYRHGPPEVLARLAAGEDVDSSEYYMRTVPNLNSGDPRYAWVNRTIFIGTGARHADSVVIQVFEVL